MRREKGTSKAKPKSYFFPHFMWEIPKFLFGYRGLYFSERFSIVGRALLIWLVISYVLIVWVYFVEAFHWYAPFPLVWANTPELKVPAACIDILLVVFAVARLNAVTWKHITRDTIEERWRRACLHVGLVMNTNLEGDIKEFPPLVEVTPEYFVISGQGVTPERIDAIRAELSSASGLFLANPRYHTAKNGDARPDRIRVDFRQHDIPFMVAYDRAPYRAGALTFGMTSYGWLEKDVRDIVHIGIAGASGNGKSMMLRSLATQIFENDSDSIILGIDFKGGAEFRFMQAHPNFVCVTDHDGAAAALEIIYRQLQKRTEFVAAQEVDTIYDCDTYVPSLFIFIDEVQIFFQPAPGTTRAVYDRAVWYLQTIAKQGRFVGIHLIVATQRPDAEALLPAVRNMLSTRIIFKVEQKEDSIMWIENAAAVKIRTGDNGLGKGRFLIRQNGVLIEAQGTYIEKSDAKQRLQQSPPKHNSGLVTALKQSVLHQE